MNSDGKLNYHCDSRIVFNIMLWSSKTILQLFPLEILPTTTILLQKLWVNAVHTAHYMCTPKQLERLHNITHLSSSKSHFRVLRTGSFILQTSLRQKKAK